MLPFSTCLFEFQESGKRRKSLFHLYIFKWFRILFEYTIRNSVIRRGKLDLLIFFGVKRSF